MKPPLNPTGSVFPLPIYNCAPPLVPPPEATHNKSQITRFGTCRPSFPWCFCFLAIFFAKPLVFLSDFCLFCRVFNGSHGKKNPSCFGGFPGYFQNGQGKEGQRGHIAATQIAAMHNADFLCNGIHFPCFVAFSLPCLPDPQDPAVLKILRVANLLHVLNLLSHCD